MVDKAKPGAPTMVRMALPAGVDTDEIQHKGDMYRVVNGAINVAPHEVDAFLKRGFSVSGEKDGRVVE